MDHPEPAQTFVAPSPEELVPLFPSYEIEGFIAAGGMGAVYHARQRSLDRPVAIKILPREFGADTQFRNSFEAEAKAMARLNHPNLISVYDFGDVDGMLYIIMELVSGKSLFHSAHGVAIEQKEAARLVVGICRGLTHAHQAGILHRDIKPANILLTPEIQPKIGDFGLARPVGHEHDDDEVIYGTPGYSAPEVLNHPEAVDQRTDLYAVGVLLYELLTGQLPADSWKAPSTLVKIDPAFDNILRRATHPSPELRHSDPNELGDELEDLLQRLEANVLRRSPAIPVAQLASPSAPRSIPSLSTKQSHAGAAAAVVVFLVTLLGILGWFIANDGSSIPTAAPTPDFKSNPPKAAIELPEQLLITTAPKQQSLPARPKKNRPPKTPQSRPSPPIRTPAEEPVATINLPADEELDPDPAPNPEPAPGLPQFDTTAFIKKGRLSLRSKATEIFEENERQHTQNIDRFERAAERIARRVDRDRRDEAEEYVETYLASVRSSNRIIPPVGKPPRVFERDGHNLREEFEEALAEQAEIVAELHDALLPLQQAYSMGLKRKASELSEDGDISAENILAAEAELADDSMIYFTALLKGADPQIPAQTPEEQ